MSPTQIILSLASHHPERPRVTPMSDRPILRQPLPLHAIPNGPINHEVKTSVIKVLIQTELRSDYQILMPAAPLKLVCSTSGFSYARVQNNDINVDSTTTQGNSKTP